MLLYIFHFVLAGMGIIVLLRNPTSRAWSDYNASQKKDASEEKFQSYTDDELQELESSDFEEKVSKNDYNMSEPFSNFIKKGFIKLEILSDTTLIKCSNTWRIIVLENKNGPSGVEP